VAGGTEGTPKKRGRKPRIDADEKRVPHPLLNANAEGATTTPLESVPSDYNEETHLPLRRKDFKSETIFLDWRADKLEAQAKQLRDESAKLKALGSAENQEDARKAIKLSKQLEELKKTLGGKLSPEQLKALGL
jgi:FKBP-type peptidyl-prolyl cis-trans isomerase (trigger factor)